MVRIEVPTQRPRTLLRDLRQYLPIREIRLPLNHGFCVVISVENFFGPQLDAMMPSWFTQGLGINFFFGGTSLLIVVGVAMDTVQQIESQLVMRNYDGFMKRGRVRGRRG